LSSILKALKKAEEQSPKLDVPSDLLKKVDTKEVVSRRAKHSRTHHRILVTAVVLIVAGLGTWLVLFTKDPFQFLQGKGKEEGALVPSAPVREANPPAASLNELPASTVQSEKVIEKTAELPREKESPAVASYSGMEKQEREVPKPARRAASSPQPSPSKETLEGHPDGSRFKLEAIVWAENESSRFAVINGQILRAGGSIDGLTILAVGKEQVSVRSSGRDWELKFTVE
jgi:hypothetical protein